MMSFRTRRTLRARQCLAALLLVAAALSAVTCEDTTAPPPRGNTRPRTFLWLFPDSAVGVGVSRQRLHWWGEDADGVVTGYLLGFAAFPGRVTSAPSPDTLRYTWVTRTDTLLAFPLDTLFRNYTVVVRAADNSFAGTDYQSIVRLNPFPFRDRNDNGVFDGDDTPLESLSGAIDTSGAVQTFPIRNTPPSIAFVPDPANPTITLRQPETTYTAATFAWKGSDPDGENTLAGYQLSLNDTTDPGVRLELPTRDTLGTIVVPRTRSDNAGPEVDADVYGGTFLGRRRLGTLPGLRLDAPNVFFVRAKDVAGEFSPWIGLPGAAAQWFVRRPRGRLLLVGDYINSDSTRADSTYRSALARVPGGEFATVDGLNIGRGLSANDKKIGLYGALVPSFVDPALIYTFLLYDYVVWYTDQYPSLGVAQLTLFTYTQNGGKLIFSTTFESSVDPRGALRDFAPIDSISSVDLSPTRPPAPPPVAGDTRIPAGFILFPDSTGPDQTYPRLAFNTSPLIHSVFMRPVYKRTDARYLYRLQPDPRNRYLGTPTVAVADGLRRNIFVGLPLHLLNNTAPGTGNPDGISAFFTRTLTMEFDAAHRINRRRF